MKLINNNILVEVNKDDKVSKSGIYIPKDSECQYKEGKVIEVGPGTKDEPMTVLKDDKILFNKFAGTDITIDDKDYKVIEQKAVLVVL